jgi:hypothetical protein
MTTDKKDVLHTIDKLADATRAHVDKGIVAVKEAASDVAVETAALAHSAGEKLKDAGDKLIKAAE